MKRIKEKTKKIFLTKNKSLLALTLGVISALAMPPFCAFPLFFITLPSLLYLIVTADNKKWAFLYGWIFGLGYFVFSLYWISNAIWGDFPEFVPLAIFGLPMLLAIYYGLAGAITKSVSKRTSGLLLVLCFAIIFSAFEIFRGTLFTGFPWNLTVLTWSEYTSIMQGSYFFGIYGFSFLSILLFSLPYLIIEKRKKRSFIVNGIALLSLIILSIIGNHRINNNDPSRFPIVGKKVMFVQPSIPFTLLSMTDDDVFEQYFRMTMENYSTDVDIIVWGETAIPFPINKYPKILKSIGKIVPQGAILLAGSIRTDENNLFYNSIVAINSNGKIIGEYDKSHLVPFGEYMPLKDSINLEKFVGFNFPFSRGSGLKTLGLNGIKISPLICYEVIFPKKILSKDSDANLIFNVSNDTFYGETTGPYQHLAIAKIQATANDIPILRVGNNGISAVISNVGEIVHSIPLNKKEAKVFYITF